MTVNSITINISIAVSAQHAPAVLQNLLATLPSDMTSVSSEPALAGANQSVPVAAGSWPLIPAEAGAEYRKVAEKNLRQLREGEIPDNGWGAVEDLPGVLGTLRSETRKVVMRAIENGGHISRDEVYAVLGRDLSQSLKGFTKPAVNLTEKMIAKGELRHDAVTLLTPVYAQLKTYQKAQGFAVPIQVVRMMTSRKDTMA